MITTSIVLRNKKHKEVVWEDCLPPRFYAVGNVAVVEVQNRLPERRGPYKGIYPLVNVQEVTITDEQPLPKSSVPTPTGGNAASDGMYVSEVQASVPHRKDRRLNTFKQS